MVSSSAWAQEFPQPTIKAPFVESEFTPYTGKGTAAITGRVFTVTNGGDPKVVVGRLVYLIPLTGYTADWLDSYLEKPKGNLCNKDGATCRWDLALPPDKRAEPYIRTARTDVDGQFWFSKIPPGEYILTCFGKWMMTDGYVGVLFHDTVAIEPGEQHVRALLVY